MNEKYLSAQKRMAESEKNRANLFGAFGCHA